MVAENNEDNLFNFLYSLKAHDNEEAEESLVDQYDVYHRMFNPNFDLSDPLSQCIVEEIVDYEG